MPIIRDNVQLVSPTEPNQASGDDQNMLIWLGGPIRIDELMKNDDAKHDKTREFGLTFKVGDQTLNVGWTTGEDLKPQVELQNTLIYYGPSKDLPVQVSLFELDTEDGKRKERASAIFKGLASFLPFLGAPGAIVSGMLNLGSVVSSYLAGRTRDDLELSFTGFLNKGIDGGDYFLTRNNGTKVNLNIPFHVAYVPTTGAEQKIKVSLHAIELLGLKKNDESKDLNLDISFGGKKNGTITALKLPVGKNLDAVAGLGPAVLYKGKVGTGVPYSISLALTGKTDQGGGNADLSELSGVVDSISDLFLAIDGNDDADHGGQVKAAAQTPRAVLMEYFPATVKLGSISGVVALKELAINNIGLANLWTPGEITQELHGPNGRRAVLHLKVEW